MSKKKRKIFSKNQLLLLFNNENYQKVISKIKQFKIEGVSDDELHKIQLTSYKKLADANFEIGDINRAMRDIESLLNIDNSDEYKLIKLKYLCYMEYFDDAVVFSNDLIISKNLKIKKEAMFLFLLANIYSGNYQINEKNLKLLPIARQNYILGFMEFFKNNQEEALLFFDKCNPRAKIEKENLKVIKSMILSEEAITNESIKPLYRFLINGEDTNLQNTKNSRIIKKEVLLQFSKNQKYNNIESLISLKSSIPIETILKEIKDGDQQTKLIYNNIVLLIEKQQNFSKALELFIKNKSKLVQFVESAVLFIQLKSFTYDNKSDRLILSFFSDYLKLHHKKLSEFQLDFIFAFILRSSEKENSIKFIEQYGGEDILFLFRDMTLMDKVEIFHQNKFNKIIKRYSFTRDRVLSEMSNYIVLFDESIDQMKEESKKSITEQISRILILFKNSQKPHKKYQPTFFEIFSSMAKFIQNFEFAKNRDLYIQLSETINKFIEIYNIDKVDLSKDIKALFTSIEKKKSIKKEKKPENETMFDMFKRVVSDYDKDDFADMLGDFDEDYLDENDLKRIKKDFIEALKNNQTPFNDELEYIEESFDNHIVFEFILDLIAKAIEFGRYDTDFAHTLLDNMDIELQNNYYREDLIVAINKYAKRDINTALIFFNICITTTYKKDRETVWYLKWLEAYVYMVDDYAQPRDKAFKGCLQHFIRVQQKKRFKTLNARFEKLIERFKDKGLF